ncbi:hypothetical protein E3N88_39048 [Mikania micrantha]|uniref:Reverse transcriptase zinc-binding domain-containing protein n=1 Tax=Mikania micrantha TaxID=192012 RepID=A0A5N6LVW8_9ASTR|nr:hypothetical protein E3N88_39048 [Mikania micrantha]
MNCLSINIRGVRGCGKASWVKRIKNEFGISFIGMQESMVSDVQSGLLSNYWGGSGFDYEFVNALGNSGGIVSLWDTKVFSKETVTKDDNFLHVAGAVLGCPVRVNIINVYAPQNNVDKRHLWARINHLIHSTQGWWIVFGDFNSVRDRDERKNSTFDPVCARDFNDFIDEAGLREYYLKGRKYTYMNEMEEESRLRREKDEIEVQMEFKDMNESELWVWSECKKAIEEIEHHKARDIRQTSRVKWATLGDENSSFFHSMVNGRKARNAIPGIMINGEWVVKPTLVKREVSDRIQCVNNVKRLEWEWRTTPISYTEVTELFNLLGDIHDLDWKGGRDVWKWKGDKDGAARNRLPTTSELIKRGVNLQQTSCALCFSEQETAIHFFTGCGFSYEVWRRVETWCHLSPLFVFDVSDLLQVAENQTNSKNARYILRGIVYTTMWALWNERNARIFYNKYRRPIEVMETIKSKTFFWIRNRSRWKEVDWNKWCNYPLDLM